MNNYFIEIVVLFVFIAIFSEEIGKYFYFKDKWQIALIFFKINIFFNSKNTLNLIANCYGELGKNENAIKNYKKALLKDKDNYQIYQNLGLSYIDLGLYDDAYDYFKTSYHLKYILKHIDDKKYTTKYKIQHDIEQLNYLIDNKLLDNHYSELLDKYEKIKIEVLNSPDFLYCLKQNTDYDKNLHLYSEKALKNIINQELDFKKLETDYKNNQPGLIYFDNFLDKEALSELISFCLKSTIWHEYERKRGYIASYMSNGFNSKIIYQLAEELKEKFPLIFNQYNLRNVWAFKYMDNSEGVLIHADEAMINVNFWITSNQSNQDPDSGGMIVFDKEAPADWKFNQYNHQTQDIEKYLKNNNAKSIKISHQQNRVVIFNSGLFHQTDQFDFKRGYENHRINITLLFGKRI